MPITIRDVAKRLNLSITTVSRALDGYNDVAEETRQRVRQAAQEMGYFPNQAARHLRRQRSDAIGYILPAAQPRFADPFFSEFIAGLGDEAAQHQVDLVISTAPPDSDQEKWLYQTWVQGQKVDGFILHRIRLVDWRIDYLIQAGCPFASLEKPLLEGDFTYVEVDNCNSVAALVQHLQGRGYQRIAYIGGPEVLQNPGRALRRLPGRPGKGRFRLRPWPGCRRRSDQPGGVPAGKTNPTPARTAGCFHLCQ